MCDNECIICAELINPIDVAESTCRNCITHYHKVCYNKMKKNMGIVCAICRKKIVFTPTPTSTPTSTSTPALRSRTLIRSHLPPSSLQGLINIIPVQFSSRNNRSNRSNRNNRNNLSADNYFATSRNINTRPPFIDDLIPFDPYQTTNSTYGQFFRRTPAS